MEYGGYVWTRIDSAKWQWVQEYVMMTSKYILACPPGRICEFGSGIFTLGRPNGSKGKFSGAREISVYGAGAIHVRVADGKGPCIVGVAQVSYKLIPIVVDDKNGRPAPVWEAVEEALAKAEGKYEEWRRSRQSNMPG